MKKLVFLVLFLALLAAPVLMPGQIFPGIHYQFRFVELTNMDGWSTEIVVRNLSTIPINLLFNLNNDEDESVVERRIIEPGGKALRVKIEDLVKTFKGRGETYSFRGAVTIDGVGPFETVAVMKNANTGQVIYRDPR